MKPIFALPCIILVFAASAASAVEPVWFNSGMNNRDITFSPDGQLMLTTVMAPRNLASVIAISQRQEDQWSPLEVAPFSGVHPDIEPAFTPDGRYLYFASKRPRPDRPGNDWDIWRVSYSGTTGWGEPENLGPSINTEGNEFYPSLTNSGVLYFTATRDDTLGQEDIYRATPAENDGWTVENLGEPVNTRAYEFNAFIAPDESYLLFGAQLREGEIGGGDLYISYRKGDSFHEPVLLGPQVNTTRLDYCPMVFGDRFYFTSERVREDNNQQMDMQDMEKRYQSPGNGLGNIYWVEFDAIRQ